MQETRVRSLGVEDPLEKGMAIHSSILAWRIPWTEKPRGLHSSWGRKESDTTEQLTHTHTHASLKWKKQSIKESMNCNYSSWFASTDWRQTHQWRRARGNQRGGSRDLYGLVLDPLQSQNRSHSVWTFEKSHSGKPPKKRPCCAIWLQGNIRQNHFLHRPLSNKHKNVFCSVKLAHINDMN